MRATVRKEETMRSLFNGRRGQRGKGCVSFLNQFVTQRSFNLLQMLLIFDLLPFKITHVKDIRYLIALCGNLCDPDIQAEIKQGFCN